MANLPFNIELFSKSDPNRKLVSNIGGVMVKKSAVKFEGNEILSVDDFDVFAYYQDLWKTDSEKRSAVRQDFISYDSCTLNCMNLRINTKDKDATSAQDNAIAKAYGNKLIIPLDFDFCKQLGFVKLSPRIWIAVF